MLARKGLNAPMGMSLPWCSADGPQCFVGLASFLGLTGGPVSFIFRTISLIISKKNEKTKKVGIEKIKGFHY